MGITGGMDWGDLLDAATEISDLYVPVFVFFIVFVVLGIMNILTAGFCESAMQIADFDRDLVIQDEIQSKDSTINQLRKIFLDADADKSGSISKEEFDEALQKP